MFKFRKTVKENAEINVDSHTRNDLTQHGQIITSIIKCGMKLLIHPQTSTVQPLKFGNG